MNAMSKSKAGVFRSRVDLLHEKEMVNTCSGVLWSEKSEVRTRTYAQRNQRVYL